MPARANLAGTINPRNRIVHAQTTTSGNFISRTDLQSIVTARGDLTRAAVLNGEAADGTSSTTLATELANSGNPAKFTISITAGTSLYSRNDAAAAAGTTSGGRFGFTNGSNTFTLGSTVSEKPSHFGAMFYGFPASGTANLVRVTATFNDASTAVYNATATAQQYTFVGIAAPIGKWISTVKVDEVTNGDWLCYDDLTVVLAPPAVGFADLEVIGGSRTLNCGYGKTAEYEFTLNNKNANVGLWQVLWEGGAPAWASTIPASGSTPGNGTAAIRVRANAAGLSSGTRSARFAVAPAGTSAANVPQNSWQTVNLNVLQPEFTPALGVFDVGGFVGFASSTKLSLTPAVPGLINLTGVSSSATWLRPYLSENGGNEVRFSFDPSGLAAGTHSATVTIESAGTIQVVTLRLTLEAQRLVKLFTDPRRNRIYALHQPVTGDGRLLALDGTTRATTHALPLGTKPTDIDLSPDGSRLYVAHANGDFRVFNPDTMQQSARYSFATTGEWNVSYDSNVSAGPGNIAFLTDGSWAPYIHVIDTAAGTVLQSILTGPANNPGDTGCGDLVYHPERRQLFTWNQYGWTAGLSSTSVSRFVVAADGRLTINGRMVPQTQPPNFRRDPLDTPILLSADGRTLVAKDRRIDMDDMSVQPVIYPQVVYTMTRDGGAVFGETTCFRGSGGTSVMNVPVATKVHTVSPDGKRLYYFNPTTAALLSVEIESSFGLPMLGISTLPDTSFVTQPQPEKIRWAPVPGAREYRLYASNNAAALSGSSPDASLLVAKTTEHWWLPDRTWPVGTPVYWRADAWTNRGVVQGDVNDFFVGAFSLDRHRLAFKSVVGIDGRTESLAITSATPIAWTAGSDSTWLKLSAASGTSPSTLGIRADTTNLTEGYYSAVVTIRNEGQWIRVPVEVIVRPRNFTRVVADPDRPHLYVLNTHDTDPAQGCFLMRFDTDAERFDRVVEVPYEVRAMAFHRGDQKVYLAYGGQNITSTIAAVPVPGMVPVGLPRGVTALDDTFAFGSSWDSLAPGPAGRLVADKRWEYMLNTADFSLVSNAPRESMAAAFHPSGLDYYAGFSSLGGPIRKYRIENGNFVQTTSRQLTLVSNNYGDSSLLVSTDGSRVSWARTIMDADLNELFAVPSSILTLTHGGEFAATATRLYNARTGLDVGALPINSTLQALNSTGNKLFQFQATSWRRAELVPMTALPSDGVITSLPADGAMVVGQSQTLSWTAVPSVLEYRLFFGASAAAVEAAGLNDPEYLGSTSGTSMQVPGTLALGASYYWRIEMVGYTSTVSSSVRTFRVAPINASPVAVAISGPVGVPIPAQQNISLTSAAPRAWTASTTTPWLQVVTTSGNSPGNLRFTIQTTGLAAGTHNGIITMATAGFPQWQIPVTLVLETANITHALLDPATGVLYGISQNANAVIGNNNVLHPAYLVVYNRATGQPQRSIPVGTSVSDIIIHEAENRLYIANWKSGQLRALDRGTLAEVALFSFTPYDSLRFGVGDVYALAPGPAGRVVMGKGPSGSSSGIGTVLNLVNTTTGAIIAQSAGGFQPGRMVTEPSGNVIQHFTQAGSNSPARRIGISGDAFNVLKQVAQPAIGFSGVQPAFRNTDGTRYFAANAVFDAELNLVRSFDQAQNARAIMPTGEIMVSSSRIHNAVSGLQIATLPSTSDVLALDDANGKLLMFAANQVLPTIVDFAALANLPTGNLTPGIANGAIIIGNTQQLSWTADARAFSYQVYFGSNSAAVAAAGTGDPEFLQDTLGTSVAAPGPLALDGEYFWRVDAIGRNGKRVGSVWSFRIAPLMIEPRSLTIDHPQGVPISTQSLAMSTGPLAMPGIESAAGVGGDSLAWSATTTTPWISIVTTSGATPDLLRFNVNSAGLAVATHQGAIRITSGGRIFDLPVALTLRTLNYMMITTDPDRPFLYAISRPSNRTSQDPSFLVVIDANLDSPTAAFPVGWGATDVTVHPEENRIYVSNWSAGELRALDRNSYAPVFYRQYSQPSVGGAEVIHAVAAGRSGRIAVTEGDQSGLVRLADSATGEILASRSVGAGYGLFDPTKRWLYYGMNSSSSGSLFKFDTLGDQLVQDVSVSPSNYLPRQVHMTAAGDRLFWGYHMLDANLTSLWTFNGPIGGLGIQRVSAIDPTGEWLLTTPQSGDGAIWNTGSRRMMFPIVESNASWEGTSPYKPYAYNPAAGRFYGVLSNRIISYQTGLIVPPVSAPNDVAWLTHGPSRWRAAPELGTGVLRGGNPATANSRSVCSVFVPTAATVSFQWSCNIPNSAHQMALLLDTTFQASITGTTAWTSRSVTVPAGGGMVSWSIRRSTTLGDSIDGLVRNITITPQAPAAAALFVNPVVEIDDDGDGHSNLMEWATGSDPADPLSRPRLTIEMRDGAIRVEFDRRSDIDGLRVEVETSDDLTEWKTLDDPAFELTGENEGLQGMRLTLPLEPKRRFLRLRAEHNP